MIFFNKTNRRTNFPNVFLSRNCTCFGQFLCPKHVYFLNKNKFGKLVRLLVLLKKIFITMHGHMNVKFIIKRLKKFGCFAFVGLYYLLRDDGALYWVAWLLDFPQRLMS